VPPEAAENHAQVTRQMAAMQEQLAAVPPIPLRGIRTQLRPPWGGVLKTRAVFFLGRGQDDPHHPISPIQPPTALSLLFSPNTIRTLLFCGDGVGWGVCPLLVSVNPYARALSNPNPSAYPPRVVGHAGNRLAGTGDSGAGTHPSPLLIDPFSTPFFLTSQKRVWGKGDCLLLSMDLSLRFL